MAGLFGIAGALAGLGPKKPDVPVFKPVDTTVSAQKALSTNLGVLPGAEKLSSALNAFNQDQLQAMLAKAIPNFAQLKEQGSADILSMLKGQLPDAVQTATRSAEKAVGGGYGGSQAASNLTLRDLSIESLRYVNSGIDAASRWLSMGAATGVPKMADPTSMFISPAQQVAVDINNTEQQWNRQWLANQIKAQPSYLDQQVMGTLDYFDSLGKQMLSMYMGNVMGGAMGGGGGGEQGMSNADIQQFINTWGQSRGGGGGGWGGGSGFGM